MDWMRSFRAENIFLQFKQILQAENNLGQIVKKRRKRLYN